MDQNFKTLFEGNDQRFLTFSKMKARDDGKHVPTNYNTIDRGVSDRDWARHLTGDVSLGLSPLRSGLVKWGAVDVDLYPFLETEDEIEELLKAWRDPCLIARSKSGGVHIIAFTDDWVPAERMRRYLETKRDAILTGDALKAAKEIFPKQDDGDGSQMNLPQYGGNRPALAWSKPGYLCFVSDKNPINWEDVAKKCRVSEGVMADVVIAALAQKPKPRQSKRSRERKEYAGGFKRPTTAKALEGRNSFLYHVGASARARGAEDSEVGEIIRAVNEEFADPKTEFGHKGPITDEKRLARVISQVCKLERGEPADLPYDLVEEFNREWALMRVEGRVEFLNHEEGHCYPHNSFQLATKHKRFGRQQMSDLWVRDPDRSEFRGIVIEAPDYDGPAWNVWRGYAVEPKAGDASLWVDYIERILCGGDKELAAWVMSYVADGVQRPWSVHPKTALALRGGQGGGKSFLGDMLVRIMGDHGAKEVAERERLFGRFNRELFGTAFILAEESIFVGDKRLTDKLKSFVVSPRWTYEQKFLATFTGKNVHRLIVTTNDHQVIDLDDDDRRWTIIEVETMFNDPDSTEAIDYWRKYYDLDPSVVLGYLLQYEVDSDRIMRPYATEAKRQDKIASDTVLELLHEIAESGIIPDDTEGRGAIASATLLRECRARGESLYSKPRALSQRLKKVLGWKDRNLSVRNALHIKSTRLLGDGSGFQSVEPEYAEGGHARGLSLGSLPEFRQAVSRITGQQYGDGDWGKFELPTNFAGKIATDADVEAAFAARERQKYGESPPF